jgi:hypothetical protein
MRRRLAAVLECTGCPLMLYPNLLPFRKLNQNQILSKSWTVFYVSCITPILHRASRMLHENAHLQYPFRITDGNRAEIYGELTPPQEDETAYDRC